MDEGGLEDAWVEGALDEIVDRTSFVAHYK
jgi:hypothetical protein